MPLQRLFAVTVVALLAACGSTTSSSGSATATGKPSPPAPAAFTGCGADHYIEPPAPRVTLQPGQPYQPPAPAAISADDVLAGVHQSLTSGKGGGIELSGPVTCHIRQLPQAQVAQFLGNAPGITPTVWVVVVTGGVTLSPSALPTGGAPITPPPGAKPAAVFFVADHHPFSVLGIRFYPTAAPDPLNSI
jgi:hypothetical protein